MCMIDGCDDMYYPFRQEMRKARNDYKCYECGRVIEMGEQYLYSTGLAYGQWDSYRTCAHCKWAADWLSLTCGGWLFGGVLEDLEEHWTENYLLRSQALGRRIILMRRRWKDKKTGQLIPVPA